MKQLLKVITVCIGLTIFQSWKKCYPQPEPNREKVQIRFKNIGESKIKKFIFNGHKIGNIRSRQTSPYFIFDKLELGIDNQVITTATTYIPEYKYTAEYNTTYEQVIDTRTSNKFTINVNVYMSCGVGFDLTLAE